MAEEHKITISEVLQYFGSGYSLENNDYTTLQWLDTKNLKPTLEQLNDKVTELQAEYDALQYQRDRLQEYPSIQELVVALYDEEDKQKIVERRTAVKAKYPKPE